MGAVYLAEHSDPRSASKKVIKILLPEFSRHPILRERFEQEALAVMRLKHPYIVEIDNFGVLPDGQLYLMMEFLDGETLESHLQRRGRCSLHHSLHIIAQVMSALLSMHEAGLVHRDLKPANIFLLSTEQNPYEVRLIDLGIARNLATPETQKRTMTGMAMGTPGYMAVEQYENAASASPAADVYAAAVIVWRMLMGQPPWGEVFDERVLYFKQRSEEFEPPPGHEVSPEVISLLRKALSREPTERPSVADFVNLLASMTPPIPPFVPSGAMILSDVAKRFIKHASVNDETVRNVSHAAVGVPVSWPHRGTELPRLASTNPTYAAPAAATPMMAATANERPGGPAAHRTTTLSGSSGVVDVPAVPATHRNRRGLRALLLAGACIVGAVVAFVVVQVKPGSTEQTSGTGIEPAGAPSAAPAPAAPSVEPARSAPPPQTVTPPPPPQAVTPPPPPQSAQAAPTVAPAVPASPRPEGASTPPAQDTAPSSATVTRPSPAPVKDASSTSRPSRRPGRDPKTTSAAAPPGKPSGPAAPPGKGSGTTAPARDDRFDPNAIVE